MEAGRGFEALGLVTMLAFLSPACGEGSSTSGSGGGEPGSGGASGTSGGTSSTGGSGNDGGGGEGGDTSVAAGGSSAEGGNASSGGVAGSGGESNSSGGTNGSEDGGSGGEGGEGANGPAPDPRCAEAEPDALQGSGTSVDPFLICLPEQLELLDTDEYALDLAYQLGDDLDVATLSTPLATADLQFAGTFDGKSHSISHLSGRLFASVAESGVIQDLDVSGVIDDPALRGFLGTDNYGTIRRVRVSGTFEFGDHSGPLLGRNQGLIEDSSASGSIEATAPHIGGLIGRNQGTVRRSFSTVDIECTTTTCARLGGLVGTQDGGTIEQSYARGTVTELPEAVGANVGGLVGTLFGGKISNCYARSPLVSGDEAGGLVGRIQTQSGEAAIENSYSTSAVSGTGAEGLVGALVGTPTYGITSSYFIDTTTGSLGTSLSDAEMKLQASYVSWSFGTIWKMDPSISEYPSLAFEAP